MDLLGQLFDLEESRTSTTVQPPELEASCCEFLSIGCRVEKLFMQGWVRGVVVDGGLLGEEDVAVVLCEDCRFLTLTAPYLSRWLKAGQIRILGSTEEVSEQVAKPPAAASDGSVAAPVGWSAGEFDSLRSGLRGIPAGARDFWQQLARATGKSSEECQQALDYCTTPPARSKRPGVEEEEGGSPQLQRGSGPRRFNQIRRFLGRARGSTSDKDEFVVHGDGRCLWPAVTAPDLRTGATPRGSKGDQENTSPMGVSDPELGSCDDLLLASARHSSVDTFMHDVQARRRQAKRQAMAGGDETVAKIRVLDCSRRVLNMLRKTDCATRGEDTMDEDGFQMMAVGDELVGGLLSI